MNHPIFDNARYQQGKKLILEAVEEQIKHINAPKKADSSKEASYQEIIQQFGSLRGAPLYYPFLGTGIGHGPLVVLGDGSVKYDCISGIGVHFFGHSHLPLVSEMIDAAVQDTVMQGNLQQNQDSYELAKLFTQELGFDHVFLTSSGAMANENALKIAFQKKQPATRILAFEGCFMGRTVMLSQITDKPEFREGLPSNMSIDYLPFYDPKQPEESTKRAVNCLRALLEHHPKQYAALCFESVQGEHGFYAGSELFFKTIIQECKHHGIAIIADEVQTFGRTQEILACKQFGVHDLVDIVSIGKMAHACATLWRKEFNPKPKLLSQTFTASTGAIRATLYMMRYLLKSDLYGVHGKNAKVFASFEEKLTKLNKQFPGQVEGPYGIGSMIAFTPCGGDAKEVAQFAQKLFHHGVIAFTAGSNPTRIRFLPPTPILEEHHIAHICDIVKQTFKEQLKDG